MTSSSSHRGGLRRAPWLLVVLLACAPSFAAEPVLMQGAKIAVTAVDIQADAQRIPVETRARVLGQPQTVGQIASNLYTRRALADKAQADGLAQDPLVQASLQQARDRVLSDALLARIDAKATPDKSALEGMARNVYVAHPERFKAGEQVRVRHILVNGTDADAKAKAQELLKELQGGADFAALAASRSADTGSAAKGGDLGFFDRGRMVPEFEAAAFALQKKGDISPLVQTQFGFHILRLDDRRPAGVRPFDEVRDATMAETLKSLQQEARVAAAQAVNQDAKLNNEAVEAFSAGAAKAP